MENGETIERSAALTVSAKEAAGLLGVSLRYVRKMIADKRLPVVRFGRKVRISRAAIERCANPTKEDSNG